MSDQSLLPAAWETLPTPIRERLGDDVGRQRAMMSEGHLLLIVHQPPHQESEGRKGRFFWRKPSGEWLSSDLGDGNESMKAHLQEFGMQLEKFDDLEAKASQAEEYAEVIKSVSPLQRTIRHLHQVLQEARQICPEDRSIINFRDRSYTLERTAELLYTGAKNGLDFAMAKRAEEQAKTSLRLASSAHRLNVLAAFFFPFSVLTALFGSNYKEVVEGKISHELFFGVIVAAVVIGGLLTFLMFKKPKDL